MVAEGDLGVFTTTYFPSKGEIVGRFTQKRCRAMLLEAIGASIDVEIVDVAPWQPHEQVADHFSVGVCYSSATQRTRCRHLKEAAPTPLSTALRTWLGSLRRC
jgi:hypothetical protein